MTTGLIVLIIVVILALIVLSATIRVLPEYQRGIVFRLGRVRPVYNAGLRFLIPWVDRLVRVDLRVITHTIPTQEIITNDNVSARVNAVVLFRVVEPAKAILEVEHFQDATSQIAQTTLRSLLGRVDLDRLLAHREDLNVDLRTRMDERTKPWGVEVRVVEIKEVELPEGMQRAMARQAEAERERRAKVINAHGELQASAELRKAAETLSASPASIQLRYLQTLLEVGADHNSTIIFPMPIDLFRPWLETGRPIPGAATVGGAASGAVSGGAATAEPAPAEVPGGPTYDI